MTGICGIVDFDRQPVSSDEIGRLTEFLGFRGPDARGAWTDGGAALGHASLCTGRDAPASQPLTLDGAVWITADARIDAQAELRRKLKAEGAEPAANAGAATLILHAYSAWREDCTRHLMGDFAFAIWDAPRRQLFCARDHFGVKPFFYAHRGNRLIFSNTLDCVRTHPAVTARLDEAFIADFLLFEAPSDPAITAFADIRRLPPAHCMVANGSGVRTKAYWTLPYEARVHYRREDEYVEQFSELLNASVADRIQADRVSLTLSGGLDSAALAAAATGILREGRSSELRGFTAVYDRLIPDEERAYSGLVGERLRIPITYRPADEYRLYERQEHFGKNLPEPVHDPLAAVGFDLHRDVASHARVALTGFDGDGLLSESPRAYFGHLLRSGGWGRLARNALTYAVAERKVVPAGTLARLAPWARKSTPAQPLPSWLNPDFAHRLQLRDRLAQAQGERTRAGHPIRPRAFRVFEAMMRRSNFFDPYDPGCTRSLVEYRHPLLDLRMLDHCLSLPPYPWCRGKEILRRAMQGALPEAVRTRPKTPLAGFPHHLLLGEEHSRWVDRYDLSPATSAFVERAKIPSVCGETDPQRSWVNLRPLSLELWMRQLHTPVRH